MGRQHGLSIYSYHDQEKNECDWDLAYKLTPALSLSSHVRLRGPEEELGISPCVGQGPHHLFIHFLFIVAVSVHEQRQMDF